MLFKITLHLLAKAQYGDRQPQAHVLRGSSCVAAQPPAHGRVAQVAIYMTYLGTILVVTADWYCTVVYTVDLL